jgi:hypothetical protein
MSRLSAYTCAVPPNLPVDPEGIDAPFPAAGPYHIAAYVPGRTMVLKRNRFYCGRRPHHVAQFVASFAFARTENIEKRSRERVGPVGLPVPDHAQRVRVAGDA